MLKAKNGKKTKKPVGPADMKLMHHGLEIELDDTWWAEAGMENFKPASCAYAVDSVAAGSQEVFLVSIEETREVRRNPGVGIFNEGEEGTARERVLRILQGFVTGSKMPPVEVCLEPADSPHRYRLVAGTHRFYCSLAAGYSHVPAILGFDINEL